MAVQNMTVATRTVSWGDALVASLFRYPRGLRGAVERIHEMVGPHIGNRQTFTKFYHVTNPSNLQERDQFRAWLLLTTAGEDAAEWGVPDDVVPRGYDVAELKNLLPGLDSNQRPAD